MKTRLSQREASARSASVVSDNIWQRFSKKFPSMDPNDLNDKLLGAGEGTTWNYRRVEFDPEV